MKVLIITYYWVPSGGSGVQRWLKFVKYLRDFGIEPIIYTVENPSYPILDDSLRKDIPKNLEVIKGKIWEPNALLSKIKKNQTKTSAGFLNSNPTRLGKILQYIRANYFIPDARKFWIKPSVQKLKKYLKDNPVDLMITTGPPHSVHVIGYELKKITNTKWMADFRDPWTNIDYFHQLPLTKKALKKHQALEEKVLKNADEVLVIGETMQKDFQKITPKVTVITNGYDTPKSISNIKLDKKFTITHIGLMNADRNPKILWEVLAELSQENEAFSKDFEVKLIGKVANEVIQDIKRHAITNVCLIDYVPHDEVMQYQTASQVLLLSVNKVPSAKGIITGKIFEYLQVKRPILAIGPKDGDLAAILDKTTAGVIVDFEDKVSLKAQIITWYQKYQQGKLNVLSSGITQFHRKELTRKLSQIIKEVSKN